MKAPLLVAGMLLLASLAGTAALRAQAVGTTRADSVQQLLDAAGRAARRYADRRVAMSEGFRRVGPDFPAMGEHWVQPGRLVSARFIADSPPILTYITVGGEPVLTGVAYALPLSARESAPSFPHVGAWHDHSASVDEESLLIAPLAHAHGARAGATPRLAMLHAWVGSANPAGVFAQENWALPYTRLGLEPPGTTDRSAALALSFLAGGDVYYRTLLHAAAVLDSTETSAVDRALARLRRDVAEWVGAQPAGWSVDPGSTAWLHAAWYRLWQELQGAVRPRTRERIAPFAPPADETLPTPSGTA